MGLRDLFKIDHTIDKQSADFASANLHQSVMEAKRAKFELDTARHNLEDARRVYCEESEQLPTKVRTALNYSTKNVAAILAAAKLCIPEPGGFTVWKESPNDVIFVEKDKRVSSKFAIRIQVEPQRGKALISIRWTQDYRSDKGLAQAGDGWNRLLSIIEHLPNWKGPTAANPPTFVLRKKTERAVQKGKVHK
jgi:hypothetical protein